jgi:hypothetical protein
VKILTYVHPNSLPKLHDELLAAVPALRPAPDPDGGLPRAVFQIWGDDQHVTLAVPDDIDADTIAAVITAHDPTLLPVPPTQAEALAAAIADANAATTSVATLDEMKGVVQQLYANLGRILDATA